MADYEQLAWAAGGTNEAVERMEQEIEQQIKRVRLNVAMEAVYRAIDLFVDMSSSMSDLDLIAGTNDNEAFGKLCQQRYWEAVHQRSFNLEVPKIEW